jgi:hypothetical protein
MLDAPLTLNKNITYATMTEHPICYSMKPSIEELRLNEMDLVNNFVTMMSRRENLLRITLTNVSRCKANGFE